MSFKWPFKKKRKAGIVGMNPEDLWEFLRRKKCGEDFSGLDFRGVLFHDMDFSTDDFPAVGFQGCDLSKTIFCECVIDGDKFYDANFLGAVFVNCDFRDMFLMNGAINNQGRMMRDSFDAYKDFECNTYATIVPPIQMDGEFVGYKILVTGVTEVSFMNSTDMFHAINGLAIAELVIPADAKRLVFKDDKCRASKVYVKEIRKIGPDGIGECIERGYSLMRYGPGTTYTSGEVLVADGFDDSYVECSSGIHFFLTKWEALFFGQMHSTWCFAKMPKPVWAKT